MSEILQGDKSGIARAAELLRANGLVSLPTETVYGLAARADSAEAVANIYRAKGRPDFNPLIVHVGDLQMARKIAEFDERAEQVAAQFWPGPLTMVLPLRAESGIAPAVTAGLPTIAVRMPDHPIASALLQQVQLPLAAPSANRSGSVSPTRADHVTQSLGDGIAAVLDGGECNKGLESTIIALRDNGEWSLLREGPVTRDELAAVLGTDVAGAEQKIEAPGQLLQHYSPGKPVRLNAQTVDADEFHIGFGDIAGDCCLSAVGDLNEAAARLYECLHQAAASDKPRVAVVSMPEEGIGAALNDRLRRAAA